MQKQQAKIGTLAAFVIGIIATVIVGGIGVAVSIRVSNNAQDVEVNCCLNSSNSSKQITVNADKGYLYYALENGTKQKNSYKIYYKTKNSASYTTAFNGSIPAKHMIGYNYACSASGWSKRYFKVQQTNHLSSKTSHCYFYAEVRKKRT